jgi:uncharacterized protein YbjT (DUF2867 family)
MFQITPRKAAMTVLLFGSTGKIGPHVARALVRKGHGVRAFVRDAVRAKSLLPDGVDIVEGDLAQVGPAIEGISSVFLLTSHGPDMASTQIGLLKQIPDASIRIVKISGTSTVIRSDGPDAGRQHHEVEQYCSSLGNPYVILRPNAFMQTLVSGMAAGIRTTGTVRNPLGTAKLSLVDAADIGEAAADALVDEKHNSKTYVLTGPAAHTYRDVAATIADVAGVSTAVVDVEPSEAAAALRARGGTAWEADHLEEMLKIFRAGKSAYVTDDIEQVLGRKPRTVADFIREHRAEFTGAQS